MTLLNVLDIAVQKLVPAFIFAYLDNCMLPVPCVQLVNQLWDEVRVVEGLLYRRLMWAWSLAFPRIRLTIGLNSIAVGPTRVIYFTPGFVLQQPQEEVTQGVAAEPSRLVVAGALDLGIILQEFGYFAERIVVNSINRQILEQ